MSHLVKHTKPLEAGSVLNAKEMDNVVSLRTKHAQSMTKDGAAHGQSQSCNCLGTDRPRGIISPTPNRG